MIFRDKNGTLSTTTTMIENGAETNPVRTEKDFHRMREACEKDPGAFHGSIAKREIHWYDEKLKAWITYSDEEHRWCGLDAKTGKTVEVPYTEDHNPWKVSFDDSKAPLYHWFAGGLTNACFNEVDRHVMMGYGDEIAYHFEGDRWDATKNDGKGGPVTSISISRKKLLFEVVKCALALKKLGVKKGDRVCLNMPNILDQIYYTEACKRMGVIYTAVFGGFSDKTLSDRIHNADAKVVITSDGAYRNAQVVPFKEEYTDKALDNYIPYEVALDLVGKRLKTIKVSQKVAETILSIIRQTLSEEITLERSDIMRAVGQALSELSQLAIKEKSLIRTEIARGLVETPQRVKNVIVVRHTGQDVNWHPERDKWSHDLLQNAEKQFFSNAINAGLTVKTEKELLALSKDDFIKAIYASSRCELVDAEYPLFFIYTSGSTGKPKGVVHVHGGYTTGVAYTMKVAFDVRSGKDTAYVIADPGWITGQSYLISGTLLTRITGVISEGSPLFPSAGRYASIIERYKVTVFKAGVTFLKSVMTNPQNVEDVLQYNMHGLRVATFCAEPCSPAVQEFGMKIMTRQYTNSYWATEHGGIVWTHFFHNNDYPLRADAHTYPMPWVFGDVWMSEGKDKNGRQIFRPAGFEEKGEIVITKPFPYLARTIWGDPENFLEKFEKGVWQGDIDRYKKTYWDRWSDGKNVALAYTQGDFAMKYPDGSFSLHGRSDDVINVSGHRMGTEEIEGAILKDKVLNPASPVGNVIVIGAPHREKGLTPVAFVVPVHGKHLTQDDIRRLNELVRKEKGSVSVPSDYIEVGAFPETRSGKYMRRFLKNMMNDEPLGDVTTLRNPESLDDIRRKIQDWKKKQEIEESQRMFEIFRYFHIQYAPVKPNAQVAIVTITNPPVNALNERSLDELNTVVDHLARRNDVKAVIFTGSGTNSFVAGADIKQFYEEIHTVADAITLPNNAHLAFAKMECMMKPIIAAINGFALGGGNEFALACHYRIAEKKAKFGQPEINLRLIPGYGGTQRLPRVLERKNERSVAIKKALEIILVGRMITSSEALKIGLIDELAEGDVLSDAVKLAFDYVLGNGGSALKSAFEYRQKSLLNWVSPGTFPEDVIADPEIQRLLKQLRQSGREEAANRIISAIRIGYESGFTRGIEVEEQYFAEAVVAEDEGKAGIRAFLDKKATPLPTRPYQIFGREEEESLIRSGELLPVNAHFYPCVTKIPKYQYCQAVVRSQETGEPEHGDPITAEKKVIAPVEMPGPNEVLLYMLTSEINFNDIWAITGIPVSQFENVDKDIYITGSGGVGLIAAAGSEVLKEGRLKVGDLVSVYSGQSDLLSPLAGLDPMFVDFQIQGYETGDGSHQQFMIVQSPQCHRKPADLTLEAAGSYVLNMSTIYRALFTTLQIEEGKSIFIEGAATGTGLEAMKVALRHRLDAIGLVSTSERAEYIKSIGATGVINRKQKGLSKAFGKVPENPSQWKKWEQAGEPIVKEFKKQNNGKLADYAISHAGQLSFPRTFQLLAKGGTLAFFGASSGYHFTFIGKSGKGSPDEMLQRIKMKANQSVLTYYGTATDKSGVVDELGLEIIETLRERGARIVVACYTNAQREFVQSIGFGDAVKAVVSIEEIKRREQDEFEWPVTMTSLPDPKRETEQFKDAVREMNDKVFKPFASEVGKYLKSPDNPRGYPDVVFERAGHDALGVSTMIVKPFTGRVVYAEEMEGKRYSFYAPQVWMRQRRIYMPSANIFGTHMSNAYEVIEMNAMIDAHLIEVSDPLVVEFDALSEAHQEMWENRHRASVYVCNHALPQMGLRTKEELFSAWSVRR